MDSRDVEFTAEERVILNTLLRLVCLVMVHIVFKRLLPENDWYLPHLINWITIFIGCGFLYSGYKSVRRMRYAEETGGRSFENDRNHYHRSYNEMTEFFLTSDIHELSREQFPIRSWKETEGIILGDADGHIISLPSTAEANLFAAGTPGSGKTTGIVIPTCLRYGGSVLTVDIKGDIYNACHNSRHILRFCPDLPDAEQISARFDPFMGINTLDETSKKLFLSNMAATLIPDQPGSDGNYFTNTARKMFIGITAYLLEIKPDISFPEVLHTILHHKIPSGITTDKWPQDIFEWVEMINCSDVFLAIEQLSSLIGNNEKNVSGSFDALCTALIPFSNQTLDVLLSGTGECISVKALEDGYDVYLQISQENLNVYAPLLTMIIQTFLSGFTKRPDTSTGAKNRPVLVLLDEFPQLTFTYNMVNTALSTLRSKSVQCLLIAQTVAQMARKYPDNGWRALLGNCNYQMVLKSSEEMTQHYFSSLFGSRNNLKITTNGEKFQYHSPRSVSEARELVFQPEDFGNMGNKLAIYFDGKYILAKKIKYYE